MRYLQPNTLSKRSVILAEPEVAEAHIAVAEEYIPRLEISVRHVLRGKKRWSVNATVGVHTPNDSHVYI